MAHRAQSDARALGRFVSAQRGVERYQRQANMQRGRQGQPTNRQLQTSRMHCADVSLRARVQAAHRRWDIEAGNGIIMYLGGKFAAVSIAAMGLAMRIGGRPSRKAACRPGGGGLVFAIARTSGNARGSRRRTRRTF